MHADRSPRLPAIRKPTAASALYEGEPQALASQVNTLLRAAHAEAQDSLLHAVLGDFLLVPMGWAAPRQPRWPSR